MTSKPYRFSKARCDPCSEDLDMIDVSFCEKKSGRNPHKKKGSFPEVT